MTYDFKICYKQGDENYAGYLSRHPIFSPPKTNYAEDHVNFIAAHSVPNALTLSDIATATKEDKILQNMITAMKTNNWKKKLCQNDKTYSAYSKLSQCTHGIGGRRARNDITRHTISSNRDLAKTLY